VSVRDETVTSIWCKMNVPKGKTYYVHDKCKIKHFFVTVKETVVELATPQYPCQKMGNMEHHYNALHSNKHDADFPPKSEIHKFKLKERKSKLPAQ
jgi:hypothetical protein